MPRQTKQQKSAAAQAALELVIATPQPAFETVLVLGSPEVPQANWGATAAYEMRKLARTTKVITTGRPGPETVAANACRKYGLDITIAKPDFSTGDRLAGVKHNFELLKRADRVLIFDIPRTSSNSFDLLKETAPDKVQILR